MLVALIVAAVLIASPESDDGEDVGGGEPETARAANVLDADAQRDALQTLGSDLCRPDSRDGRQERSALRSDLRRSMSKRDVERFWTRAVAGKPAAAMDRAFYGCTDLTAWMRDLASATDVDVERIIAEGAVGEAGVTELAGAVSDVVDGDTIKVEVDGFETVVRLLGIDAPETRQPGEPVQCFGPEATRAAQNALPIGTPVVLRTDPSQDTRDRYGRLLAYVHLDGSGGVDSVNHDLVRDGYATTYVYAPSGPVRYHDAFATSEAAARDAGRGLWGPPCSGETDTPPPPEPAPAPERAEAPAPAAGLEGGPGCDPNYEGVCVPVVSGDLNCPDIAGSVRVVGVDHHGLDRDGDGFGCESNGGAGGPSPGPPPEPVAAAGIPDPGPACDPNYSGTCVPDVGYDLDCGDIAGSVVVVGIDRHRFDGDGDGRGCE